MEQGDDPKVIERRARIDEVDERLLELVNDRIELVAGLHAHKREHGYSTVDPDRERRMLDRLDGANPGPLTPDGLRRLYAALIPLCTEEARRLNDSAEVSGER